MRGDALKLTFWIFIMSSETDTRYVLFCKLLDVEILILEFALPDYSELALKSRACMKLGSQEIKMGGWKTDEW